MVLQAGGSHMIWMDFHSVINFVGPSGQTRVIPVVTVEGAEVKSHTLGAIDVGRLMV